MVTENVDIRFRETGARVIKRKIDEMGQSANNATRGIFLMQRALFVLGGAGAIRALSRQVDMLTNYENRLRLTTSSAENLEVVQTKLFQTARDSRSSFESVAEIYSRTALSVRELGISQQETIRFTESLAKSTIISGASAREAHAALIQLGQGMASNTLRGDELRSVLEQLPFVADVISKHFGVTRGELRELGAEGKISAKDILEAFKAAEKEIDALFANTVPTIEQALTVANTNWLQFLDSVDDATGASASLAKAIIVVSKNIDILVLSLGSLAAAWAISFSVGLVERIFEFKRGLLGGAVASSRLLEIENLRAASSIRRAQAVATVVAVNAVEIQQGIVQLQQNRQILLHQKAEQAITIINGRARSVLTGQFVSLTAAKNALNKTTIALIGNERLLTASGAQLAASTGAQAGAANALAAANTRLAVSQAASSTIAARFTRTFPLLASAIGLVSRGLAALWALVLANPIAAIVVATLAAGVALFKWGNEIKVTEDKVVGLRDVFVAAFQLMVEAVQPLIDIIDEELTVAIEKLGEAWKKVKVVAIQSIKNIATIYFNVLTFLPRVTVSIVGGIIAAWEALPKAATAIMISVANVFLTGFEDMANSAIKEINSMIESLNDLVKFVGADKAFELFGFSGQFDLIEDLDLPKLKVEALSAGESIAEAFGRGFLDTFDSLSLDGILEKFGPIWAEIIKRARENIAKLNAELDKGGGRGDKGVDPKFQKIIDKMNEEIRILGLSISQRRIQQELLKIENSLKRELTATEEKLAISTIKNLNAAKDQAKAYNEIKEPMDNYIRRLHALNILLIKGRISLEEFKRAIAKNRTELLDTQTGAMAGFERGLIKIHETSLDVATGIENALTNTFTNATDAFVEFVQTGKLSFKSLIDSLIADLTRLAFQRAVVGAISGALSGLFAPTGGGGGGGETGDLISSFASGGSILPSGSGSSDTQTVMFKKRPDERVDILTPEQQRKGNGGGRNIVFNQTIQIMNPIDPDGFKRSQPQIAARGLADAQRASRRFGN